MRRAPTKTRLFAPLALLVTACSPEPAPPPAAAPHAPGGGVVNAACALVHPRRARAAELGAAGHLARAAEELDGVVAACPNAVRDTPALHVEALVALGAFERAREIVQRGYGAHPPVDVAAALAKIPEVERALANATPRTLIAEARAAAASGNAVAAARLFDVAMALAQRSAGARLDFVVEQGVRADSVAIGWARDGRSLTVVHGDAVSVIEVPSGRVLERIPVPAPVAAVSSDGAWVLATEATGYRVWDVARQEPAALLASPADLTVEPFVAFSPDGKRVASVHGNNVATKAPGVVVWDRATGALVARTRPAANRDGFPASHADAYISVAFSPSGRHVAAGDRMGAIDAWDLDTSTPVLGTSVWEPEWRARTPGIDGTTMLERGIKSLAFSPDERSLLVCWGECVVYPFKASVPVRKPTFRASRALSIDEGTHFGWGSSFDGFFDARTGRLLERVDFQRARIDRIVAGAARDGRVALSTSDRDLILVERGNPLRAIVRHRDHASEVRLDFAKASGGLVISAFRDLEGLALPAGTSTKLEHPKWPPGAREKMATDVEEALKQAGLVIAGGRVTPRRSQGNANGTAVCPGKVGDIQLSPDRRLLAIECNDAGEMGGHVRLVDLRTGVLAATIHVVSGGAYVVTPDGRIEFFGPSAEDILRATLCRVGKRLYGFDACAGRALRPGLLRSILSPAGD